MSENGESQTRDELREQIVAALRKVYDPEIPINIYAMGLIYEINIDENSDVEVVMTLTSPNCPVAESLPKEVEDKIRILPGVRSMKLDLVFEPPWSMDNMSEAAKLELGMM